MWFGKKAPAGAQALLEKLPKKVSKRVVRKGGNYAIMIGIIVWAGCSPEEAKEERKMKKRLLALALCLVLAVSLLPITATADDTRVFKSWVMKGEVQKFPEEPLYYVSIDNLTFSYNDITIANTEGGFFSEPITTDLDGTQPINTPPEEGNTYYVNYFWMFTSENFHAQWADSFSANLEVPGYETKCIRKNISGSFQAPILSFDFSLTKKHDHDWQLTPTDSSLTFTCGNPGCTIGTVGVAITAHSVTLPESPFNATVEVSENFKEAFPGAEISDVLYQYNDSGSWSEVDPKTFTPKPGEYQAGVCVSGLPTGGDAAARALSTGDGANQGAGTVFLFVKYTAVDPAVTAQTGDSRPIELMMAGVAVFSVLAAAAFILDNKRRLHQ